MSTRFFNSAVLRSVAVVIAGLASASCGSEMLRTGRSPVILIIEQLQASPGGDGTFETPLLSDVQTEVDDVPTVINDLGRAAIRAELKDQTGNTVSTPLNAVTITRYRVTYQRSDGRNTPGVDVPFGFDGATTVTVLPGSSAEVIFDLVRHTAKSEPPLRNLIAGGGLRFINTVAQVTFFGRDQNGNELMASGSLDVVFGDFADQ